MTRPAAPGRQLWAGVLALLVLVLGLATPRSTALAQQSEPATAASTLRLTSITPWVDRTPPSDAAGGDATNEDATNGEAAPTVEVRVAWTNDGPSTLEEGRVVVELLDRVDRRSELHAVLTAAPGSDPPPAVAEDLTLRAAAPGERIGVDVALPAGSPQLDGVHPVVVSVVRGTTVVDQLRTATVVHTGPVARPAQLAVVAPLGGTIGVPGRFDADAWRTDGRLARRMRDLAAAPASLSVRVQPALVEDLTRTIQDDAEDAGLAADAIERLEGLADDGHELLPAVYARSDLAALAAGGDRTTELAGELATAGDRRLAALLPGTRFAASTVLPDGPVTPAVSALVGDRLLLDLDTLEGPLADIPAALRQPAPMGEEVAALFDQLDTKASLPRDSATRLPVALADPVLEATLDGTTPPLLAAQRVLAETALAAEAGIDLVAAPTVRADTTRLFTTVMARVDSAPWVRATTIDRVFRGHATPALPAVALEDRAPRVGSARIAAVGAVVDELVAALSAIPGEEPRVDGQDPNALFDQLLRATSVDLAGDPAGDAMVADVADRVDAAFGRVRLDVPPVTLTSDRGSIPVTVRRTDGGPLTVLVAVEASSGGLTWPEGRAIEVELEPGRARSIPFEAEARSRGDFPVTVRVTDPNGQRELATARVAVTSTAISGTALGLVVLLAVVLLLVGRLRRHTRTDQPTDERLRVVRDAAPGADASGQEIRR